MPETPPAQPPPSLPRAFSQGVGLLFQWTGVTLFLIAFFVCCASSLISRDRATQTDLTHIAWAAYSAQRAITIALLCAVFFGMALAGLGLGMQAQSRRAPDLAVLLTLLAAVFWLVHTVYFVAVRLWLMLGICIVMAAIFIVLLVFAVAARREMRLHPPPEDLALLPRDYKIPYSHQHEDPPEVRLARELELRRQRLSVQQKELEMLEEKLKRKLQQSEE